MDEGVIAWVNDLRAEHGLGEPLEEMPKGWPRDAECCPIAHALGGIAVVGRTTVSFATSKGIVDVAVPEWVARFIDDVDTGRRPDLEIAL